MACFCQHGGSFVRSYTGWQLKGGEVQKATLNVCGTPVSETNRLEQLWRRQTRTVLGDNMTEFGRGA